VLDAPDHRTADGTHRLHGEADQQRHEQRLEHLARGERGDEGGRDDAQQEVGEGAGPAGLRGAGLGGVGAEVQPAPGLDQVADDQADGQRHGGHRQEVAEREPADLADPGRARHRADPEHDRAEDHRGDHHLDQGHERRADRLELHAEVGGDQADDGAQHHGHDDRDVEQVGAVPAYGPGRAGGRWRRGLRHGSSMDTVRRDSRPPQHVLRV